MTKESKEEDIVKFFAKLGYTPNKIDQLRDAIENVRSFIQYVGTNQYYGDSVNKKVFMLGLDADYYLLTLDKLDLAWKNFSDKVSQEVMLDKTPSLEEKEFSEFKKKLSEVEVNTLKLLDDTTDLIQKIKKDAITYDYKHNSS
ncbi:hypothetical protein HUU53_01760 [Candidatus Micrarchaeota archaeon]|nr:hypothetical protein [Candidatus Micrarchaeota archaeon]